MSFTWVPMMAAMMLPSAAPAIARRARDGDGVLAAPLFAAVYFCTWVLAGLVVYALYRPPGAFAAGVLVVAGASYELTPFKRACRARCRARVRSGALYGLDCIGSNVGLMLILAGAGLMRTAWMCAIAAVVVVQKLLTPRHAADAAVALALAAVALT